MGITVPQFYSAILHMINSIFVNMRLLFLMNVFITVFIFLFESIASLVLLMFQSLCNTNIRNVVIVGDFPVQEI